MSFPEFTALARHLDRSDPDDRGQQSHNLSQLRELCDFVRGRVAPDVASCLDATTRLLEVLAGPCDRLERGRVKDAAYHLLDMVDGALENFGEPCQGTPSPYPPLPQPPLQVSQPAATADDAGASARISLETPDGLNPELPEVNNMVLGQILVEFGHVTQAQVTDAARLHRTKGLPMGECLVILGSVSPDRVLDALKIQERMRAMATDPSPKSLVEVEQPERRAQSQAAQTRDTQQTAKVNYRVTKDVFIGEVLLHAEMITNEQLEQAMHLHYHEGLRVGEALVKLGVLTEAEVERGLELQRSLRHVAGLAPG